MIFNINYLKFIEKILIMNGNLNIFFNSDLFKECKFLKLLLPL